MQALKLAAAQTVPVCGDVEANLEDHRKLAALAVEHQAHLVVFPELSLTGYEIGLAEELAFSEDDRRLESLRALATQGGVLLVVGAPVRLSSRLHIGAFALDPDGSCQLYTKHHPTVGEQAVFLPGTLNPSVRLGDERAALAICADTSHPSHAAAAAATSASLYLAGVFFTPAGYEEDAKRLGGYAAEHSMAVVMANMGGFSGGLEAVGGSAVWSESGRLVAKLDGPGAGLAIASRSGVDWSGETARL